VTARTLPGVRSGMWPTATVRALYEGASVDLGPLGVAR
jgi:hypothetical protein